MRDPHEVMVLVRRGDDFLVLLRAEERDGYWHVVAGGVEPGESPREAALRELEEEVGLRPEALFDLRRRFAYPLADESEAVRARFAPTATQVEVDCFVAEAPRGWEPRLDEEHVEYRWCPAEEAAQLLFWPEPRELTLEVAR